LCLKFINFRFAYSPPPPLGDFQKGKHIFVEDDVTRDDDVVGGEVQTPIPLVVRGVAEE
jgi:hypothetical protein